MNIKPCLLAMPADCAVKTLLLTSGIYSGSQNANVLIEGESSVEILGENGGAIFDGSGTDSLISVTGKGSLRLANLTLQHAFIPASDAADAADGPALSVVGQGSCQVFGVRFLNNTGRKFGGAVNIIDTKHDRAAWLDISFTGCTWEHNTVPTGSNKYVAAGAVFSQDAAPSFTQCTWRENTAGSPSVPGYAGAVMIDYDSTCSAAPQVAFRRCAFVSNDAGYIGGGLFSQHASPRFDECVFTNNPERPARDFARPPPAVLRPREGRRTPPERQNAQNQNRRTAASLRSSSTLSPHSSTIQVSSGGRAQRTTQPHSHFLCSHWQLPLGAPPASGVPIQPIARGRERNPKGETRYPD